MAFELAITPPIAQHFNAANKSRHVDLNLTNCQQTLITFWQNKLAANVERDAKVLAALRADQWRVIVIWECEINEDRLAHLVSQLRDIDALT